jgi:hypothetical protein
VRKRIHRPSPALAISLIALFVALGGTGYAAVKVNGKNIKNGTIAGSKLKSKTITAGKIKNNAIGAAEINEGKLGTVPRATDATNAANAANATNAVNATNAGTASKVSGRYVASKRATPTSGASSDAARAAAPEIVLFSVGPLTLYGKCYSSGSSVYGAVFVKTAEGGSIFLTSSGSNLYGSPYLEPGTDEMQRYAYSPISVGPNSTYALTSSPNLIYAAAPDGTQFNARFMVGLKSGNPPNGNGPYGAGDACLFSASADQLN